MVLFATLLGLWASVSQATIIDNGKLAVVDGMNYYVGGRPMSKISPLPSIMNENAADSDLIPITVVQSSVASFTTKDMDDVVANFTHQDDVFQAGFLQAVFLNYIGDSQGRIGLLNQNGTLYGIKNSILIASSSYNARGSMITADVDSDTPPGPYFMSIRTGALYQAFRLYSDHQLAFTQPAISDDEGGFMPLPAITEGAMTQSIAVPSRLYYTPSFEKPLAGLRLGVKDIIHLQGLRTSGGNRAFHDFYPPQNKTASSIQRLVDAGAVIVGKMGTVQFANGDNPTADWVDFHCPFNPRGDGYQSPGGSSSGPAAGIASYEWLDIAVGSDTGGSMRNPAGLNGVYGSRPSTGAVGTDGVLPLAEGLDTVGVFARDARVWRRVMDVWLKGENEGSGRSVVKKGYREYPRRLFYSKETFADAGAEAGRVLEGVVRQIEAFLGVEREVVSVFSQWEESHPAGAPDDLIEMINTTYAVLTSVYQYNNLALPFFTDYATANSNSRPFINPGPLVRWQWGQENANKATYHQAQHNKTTFASWWSTSAYGLPDNETCSEGLFVYPYSTGKTQYRNLYTDAPTEPPMGWRDGRIATLAGVPDFVVPVGEVPYNSTVSLKEEYMPVTLSLVAARGCDLMLADLVEELQEIGVLKAPGVGTRMYG